MLRRRFLLGQTALAWVLASTAGAQLAAVETRGNYQLEDARLGGKPD